MLLHLAQPHNARTVLQESDAIKKGTARCNILFSREPEHRGDGADRWPKSCCRHDVVLVWPETFSALLPKASNMPTGPTSRTSYPRPIKGRREYPPRHQRRGSITGIRASLDRACAEIPLLPRHGSTARYRDDLVASSSGT